VNNEVAKWLMAQGLEVVLPPLLTFFCGSFIGYDVGVKERIRRPDLLWLLATTGQKYVQAFIDEAEAVLQSFRYHHPHRTITEISQTAKAAVHLTHQYGEGWLLSGEVGEYVRAGVQNVLCLQPFGCIANHVIAKGVAKRLKGIYSDLNLLFLDLDAGASEVNFLNRLHFFVEQAKRAGQSAPRGG
jgi:predicted nucleotide-binding protein (sugar kinase/HSP70/actin superfamily)